MQIRYARETDIPRLGELLLQVCRVHREGRPDIFREGGRKYNDGELRAILQDPGRTVLVAEDEGQVVGYAFCELQRHSGEDSMERFTTLYLDDLCVDESCRGRGAGRALYEAALNLARAAGCHNLTLNVWSRNEKARKFYENMGLQVQKIGMEVLL